MASFLEYQSFLLFITPSTITPLLQLKTMSKQSCKQILCHQSGQSTSEWHIFHSLILGCIMVILRGCGWCTNKHLDTECSGIAICSRSNGIPSCIFSIHKCCMKLCDPIQVNHLFLLLQIGKKNTHVILIPTVQEGFCAECELGLQDRNQGAPISIGNLNHFKAPCFSCRKAAS